jgi:hypothetical protein
VDGQVLGVLAISGISAATDSIAQFIVSGVSTAADSISLSLVVIGSILEENYENNFLKHGILNEPLSVDGVPGLPGPGVVHLGPNPSSGQIAIRYYRGTAEPTQIHVRLYDMAWRIVMQQRRTASGKEVFWPLDLVAGASGPVRSGVYWLVIEDGGRRSSKKLVVLR